MAEKTRVARHNGRGGKNGAYSAKHSDRNFDVSTTPHIDPSLTSQNISKRYAGDFDAAKTNEEYELAYYEAHFRASLDRKNASYKAKGKAGQIKTMEDYHRSMKSCPEETYYTAGAGVDRELLWLIYTEHQLWKAERYPQCQTLTADLHADEPGAMLHIHERSVWIGHDSKGMEGVGQAKALAEMGVERPDLNKAPGKYNNAKQTYTRECRENFISICQQHGLEIILEAKPADEVGLELMEYKIQHAKTREAEAESNAKAAQDEAAKARLELDTLKEQADQARQEVEAAKEEAAQARQEAQEQTTKARQEAEAAKEEAAQARQEVAETSRRVQQERARYDQMRQTNDANIAIIRAQEETLELIGDYSIYLQEADAINQDIASLEEIASKEIPAITRYAKSSETIALMERIMQIIRRLLRMIEAGIRRLQIYEMSHGVEDRRSEPAQRRAAALGDMIAGAEGRAGGGRQEAGKGYGQER